MYFNNSPFRAKISPSNPFVSFPPCFSWIKKINLSHISFVFSELKATKPSSESHGGSPTNVRSAEVAFGNPKPQSVEYSYWRNVLLMYNINTRMENLTIWSYFSYIWIFMIIRFLFFFIFFLRRLNIARRTTICFWATWKISFWCVLSKNKKRKHFLFLVYLASLWNSFVFENLIKYHQ